MVLTPLGKLVAGAPPADAANYLNNVLAFAVVGATMTPLATWTKLRRVPLWRAVAEPLVWGVIGAIIAAALGSGAGLLVLAPAGIAMGVARLQRVHRDDRGA